MSDTSVPTPARTKPGRWCRGGADEPVASPGGPRRAPAHRGLGHDRIDVDGPGPHRGRRGMNSNVHEPALVDDATNLLSGAAVVVDMTVGGGGHASALLEAGVDRVIGIDRDPDALAIARG